METVHVPVLLREVIESLRADRGGSFLDCTLGGGGHTEAILQSHPENRVVAFDRDRRAIERAEIRLSRYADRVKLIHAPFSSAPHLMGGERFDGVLADLGLSTDQLKEQRGFSFNDESAIDMRMNEEDEKSGTYFVNEASDRELYAVLKRGGVGAEAKKVVAAIVKARPITTAVELSQVVRRAVGFTPGASNPATVIFQAIRIAVNREMEEIEALLDAVPHLVAPKARVAIISFHSLEDREVASKLRHWQQGDTTPPHWPGARQGDPRMGSLLTRKAITPGEEEIARNPASRSARMRVFEFF